MPKTTHSREKQTIYFIRHLVRGKTMQYQPRFWKKVQIVLFCPFSPHELAQIRVNHLPVGPEMSLVPHLCIPPGGLYALGMSSGSGINEVVGVIDSLMLVPGLLNGIVGIRQT